MSKEQWNKYKVGTKDRNVHRILWALNECDKEIEKKRVRNTPTN
ncbi:unnamed protein product [marine sediment metagenome]|uniref:Uncharacterized protein n=1 Tax=marine sediment metagenome TaxID=412755 RepID=X0WZT1_9ZZZZ